MMMMMMKLTDSSRPHVETKDNESSQEPPRSKARIARRDSATGASLRKRSRVRGEVRRRRVHGAGERFQYRAATLETWRMNFCNLVRKQVRSCGCSAAGGGAGQLILLQWSKPDR